MPKARPVPRIVESTVVTVAIIRLFLAAAKILALVSSLAYQASVKPSQLTLKREALKENTTRTAMGKYKKRYL